MRVQMSRQGGCCNKMQTAPWDWRRKWRNIDSLWGFRLKKCHWNNAAWLPALWRQRNFDNNSRNAWFPSRRWKCTQSKEGCGLFPPQKILAKMEKRLVKIVYKWHFSCDLGHKQKLCSNKLLQEGYILRFCRFCEARQPISPHLCDFLPCTRTPCFHVPLWKQQDKSYSTHTLA